MNATMEEVSRKLKLTEDEANLVVLGEADTRSTASDVGLCLLGRIFTKRVIDTEVLKATLILVWCLSQGVNITVLGENLFLFQFVHLVDKSKVLSYGPWSFDKHLLFCEFDPSLKPSKISFTYASFWIYVYNLPLISMTKSVGMVIANTIGSFIDMDYGDGGTTWENFLRIQVWLNVSRPLQRCMLIALQERDPGWVSFKYERLPNFCYYYRMLGHDDKECHDRLMVRGGL
ncbi:hypothetical protein LOK49_LG12G02504 [Camellia lanceoleosa]|uniref:Uncharacterized protein n=1 Tax=Camellia lanceoleosa TaxID=1840588 RepID=A0ACC0FPV8_9ERIC|nr:hypothetical protein LOK49_LG12G02504 [Camellia lanceoleosa]